MIRDCFAPDWILRHRVSIVTILQEKQPNQRVYGRFSRVKWTGEKLISRRSSKLDRFSPLRESAVDFGHSSSRSKIRRNRFRTGKTKTGKNQEFRECDELSLRGDAEQFFLG
jgi:hypothetical protein